MNKRIAICIILLVTISLSISLAAEPKEVVRTKATCGADEKTPSIAHYFPWIDHTNQGGTEATTNANLDFFKWMHDTYGMQLEIYVLSVGTFDAPAYYGGPDTERFKRKYPSGLDPILKKADSFGCRLGLWMGPDGFGDTKESAKARKDLLVSLCRDHNFYLFKVDSVCGVLPPEKTHLFVDTLKECRRVRPDLIVLNHRLRLGEGNAWTTTTLWGGESYIGVWRFNRFPATHNRACVLALGMPLVDGVPQRLREDHGTCLSSELDYWEDDLAVQAFSRNMILAPQVYGSPWFLRDEELPKLARIYNLTRRYRDILVNGMVLPHEKFGPYAVSRGDDQTRMVTLRNLNWETVRPELTLGEEIGLKVGDAKSIEVRMIHPWEEVLGTFKPGEKVAVPVLPFRPATVIATAKKMDEVAVVGTPYQVIRNIPGKPVVLELLGDPGTTKEISLTDSSRKFTSATLDGKPAPQLLGKGSANKLTINFPGKKRTLPWHRKLADLQKCDVPADAEQLYEATCYAADNNAMEFRSKVRAGETKIPQVKAARDGFFAQDLLRHRGCWDQYLFDGKLDTYFRLRTQPIWGGTLRVDFGKPEKMDTFVLERCANEYKGKKFQPTSVEVSADLKNWTKLPLTRTATEPSTYVTSTFSIEARFQYPKVPSSTYVAKVPASVGPVRYVRVEGSAVGIAEIYAKQGGKKLAREGWRASNVFAPYRLAPAKAAWAATVQLGDEAPGSYLVVPCYGKHGRDGVYAALRVDGKYVGAPRRAVAYPANPWEVGVQRPPVGLTYYFPVTDEMRGKKVEVVLMQFESEDKKTPVVIDQIKPEAWITSYPVPFVGKKLVLK